VEDPGTRATIDGLNTQLAEVSSSLAEKVAMLERDKDVLGSVRPTWKTGNSGTSDTESTEWSTANATRKYS